MSGEYRTHVCGVDRDEHKVSSVRRGEAPFYEPGLETLVKENVSAGRLTASVSTAEALDEADVALVCVGTPSERNGNLGLDQLRRATEEVAAACAGRTAAAGGGDPQHGFSGHLRAGGDARVRASIGFAWWPIRSFCAKARRLRTSWSRRWWWSGGIDSKAMQRWPRCTRAWMWSRCLVALRTAEMIKYACNAFHAVKIGFANEIGALRGSVWASPPEEVMERCAAMTN